MNQEKNSLNFSAVALRAWAGATFIGLLVALAALAFSAFMGFNAPGMRGLAVGTLTTCFALSLAALSGYKTLIGWARRDQGHGAFAVSVLVTGTASLALLCPFAATWIMCWPETIYWEPGVDGHVPYRDLSILNVAADGWHRNEPIWLYQNLLLGFVALPGSHLLFLAGSFSICGLRSLGRGLWRLLCWSGRSLMLAPVTPKKEA